MSMRLFHFGIVLPLLIGLALLALGWQWNRWHAWLAQRSWRRQAWRAWLLCFAAWLVSLGVFVGALLHSSRTQPADQTPVAIVVLGSGTPRCQVSPTLAERLKVAQQWAQRLPQAPVVVSGGKDLWLDCTESAVMQAWLVQHGVDATRIVQEPRSTSTATVSPSAGMITMSAISTIPNATVAVARRASITYCCTITPFSVSRAAAF